MQGEELIRLAHGLETKRAILIFRHADADATDRCDLHVGGNRVDQWQGRKVERGSTNYRRTTGSESTRRGCMSSRAPLLPHGGPIGRVVASDG
jgi:hypothetical protein